MYSKCTDVFLQNHANICRLVYVFQIFCYTCIHESFYSVAIDKSQINIFLISNYGTRV